MARKAWMEGGAGKKWRATIVVVRPTATATFELGSLGSHTPRQSKALPLCSVHRRLCAEQPTADDRAVLNDLLGGIDPYRVECSGFTPLVDASCRCRRRERHRSLSPGCVGPQVPTRWLFFFFFFQFGGLAHGGGGRSRCFS